MFFIVPVPLPGLVRGTTRVPSGTLAVSTSSLAAPPSVVRRDTPSGTGTGTLQDAGTAEPCGVAPPEAVVS